MPARARKAASEASLGSGSTSRLGRRGRRIGWWVSGGENNGAEEEGGDDAGKEDGVASMSTRVFAGRRQRGDQARR